MQAALKSWERPLADFQQGQGCQFYDCKALDSTNNPREPGNRFSTAAAAAAAKSLQSCPTLCDPIDGSPPGSPVPGILQARTLEWVAISFSNSSK